jgi:hypothetical protein
MTIAESLMSLNPYPIPNSTVEKICTDRGLDKDTTYTKTIGESQDYELATADIYLFLFDSPNLIEQAVGITQLAEVKKQLLKRANQIYSKYEDSKFRGKKFGFIGENYNG